MFGDAMNFLRHRLERAVLKVRLVVLFFLLFRLSFDLAQLILVLEVEMLVEKVVMRGIFSDLVEVVHVELNT